MEAIIAEFQKWKLIGLGTVFAAGFGKRRPRGMFAALRRWVDAVLPQGVGDRATSNLMPHTGLRTARVPGSAPPLAQNSVAVEPICNAFHACGEAKLDRYHQHFVERFER